MTLSRRVLAAALALGCLVTSGVAQTDQKTIKTRLDHLGGTRFVLVVSYLPAEITSITCEKWTMMGIKSWDDQNNFTIPAGPSVAVMDTHKFDGYCQQAGSIVAHTDEGDFHGVLDRGQGNWQDSTKLTFLANARMR